MGGLRNKLLGLMLLLLLSVSMLNAQTFTNSTTAAASSWNSSLSRTITVSGLPTLQAGTFELIQANVHMGNPADAGFNFSRYTITVTSPAGTTITLVSGNPNPTSFPNSTIKEFNTKFRDNTYLRVPANHSASGEPFNVGYYRSYQSFAAFNGENPNGIWTILITENSTSQGARFNKVDLVFRAPLNVVDYTSSNAYDACSTPYCLHSSEIIIASNNGFTNQGSDMYNPTTSGCSWNAAQNNSAWFKFVAAAPTAHFTISAITGNLQILGVSNSSGNPCNTAGNVVISGGCPDDLINDTYAAPQYTNGSSINDQLNMSGLTVGQIYYVVVDGNSASVSPFYIEIDGASPLCDTCVLMPVASYNNPICNGDSIRLSVDVGTSWNWSGPGGFSSTLQNPVIPNANASHSGMYSVLVSNGASCTGSANVTVTVNAPPTAGITNNSGGSTQLTCTLLAINATATGGISYQWSGGATPDTAANSFTTPGTYAVTVTGAGGCTDTDSIVITQSALVPIAGIVNNTGTTVLTCTTTSISVTATGGASYLWSGGATTGTAANSFTTAGTYTVTVTASNGCVDTASIVITQNNTPPTAGIVNNTGTTVLTCAITSISVTATGGGTYLWSGGVTTGTASNSFTEAGIYTVTVTAANGCTNTESITITQNNTPPVVGITNNSGTTIIDCVTTGINVVATGGGTYSWSGGTSLNTADNSFAAAGTYVVTVTASNACTATSSVTITQAPPIDIVVTNLENDHCLQGIGSITVNVENSADNFAYTWLLTPHVAGNTLSGLKAGIYQVVASNGVCVDTLSVVISDVPGPIAAFQPSPITSNTNSPITFINQSLSGDSYHWSFGDGAFSSVESPSHIYSSAQMYEVYLMVMDAFGCVDSVAHTVVVVVDINIFIPNTFTPNGDGVNDEFRPYGTGYDLDDYEMTIYDRWGGLVFSSAEFEVGWDGRHKGIQLDINNVFTYRMVVYDLIGKEHIYVGRVTMIGSKMY